MNQVSALYFDGKTSRSHEVEIQFYPPEQIRITGLDRDLYYKFSDVKLSPRVGNTPRSIYLPEGAKCETTDNETIDLIQKQISKKGWQIFVHKLESKLHLAIAVFIIGLIGLFWIVESGLPRLSKRVAFDLPESVNSSLGRDGLKVLDETFLSPSELKEEKKREIHSLFDDLIQGFPEGKPFKLVLRKSKVLKANAIALPSGIIILTDDLILLAENENELIAVLAHEFGHVIHRHALRSLFQYSAAALLISVITGDVTSMTSLSTGLPVLFLQNKYSREFETEADRFSLEFLKDRNISPIHFVDFFQKLTKDEDSENSIVNYLSTHPSTSERLKMFQETEG